jgi:hypothetical protein
MVSLARSSNGSYRARKRIPDDVREDDSHLYGARHEATFSAPAATKPHEAKQPYCEWLKEVEARIDAFRRQHRRRHFADAIASAWAGG